MDLKKGIRAFSQLGEQISHTLSADTGKGRNESSLWLAPAIQQALLANPWFTPASIRQALESIAKLLKQDELHAWTASYPALQVPCRAQRIGVIMAGNIPLVGFHDFLCVLLSGHHFIGKLSSRDDHLLKALAQMLCQIEPEFNSHIIFLNDLLQGYDAVIATGSNNSARQFEYYFREVPHLIRRNRNGIAILSGNESQGELELLGSDIFLYFGLGCRNVSKIYVPQAFGPADLYPSLEKWKEIINHHHYANNYEYNRAVFLVNNIPHFDNNFLLLREEMSIPSPVAVLHFERYQSDEILARQLQLQLGLVQCIVSGHWKHQPAVAFGQAQHPALNEYADGVDTLAFLSSLTQNV